MTKDIRHKMQFFLLRNIQHRHWIVSSAIHCCHISLVIDCLKELSRVICRCANSSKCQKTDAYFENDSGEVQQWNGCGLEKNLCLNCRAVRSKEVHTYFTCEK